MSKMIVRFMLFLMLICVLPLAASDELEINEALMPDAELISIDDIQNADIPISYGEASFRTRILERTKGERDPIGLVLTGGSARAFAHLGVLKYLEEAGIEPDFIISNSMGSIIGMLYAAGLSPDQILEMITTGELSTFFKMTAPIQGGVLDPSGFKGAVEFVTGSDLQIEDLPIPTMVICQDMVTKREIRIMEGKFSDILVGAFALPVYFPPVEYKGHLLLDGGIITLAPISVAYDYSDTVIVSTTFYDNESLNLKNPLTIVNTAFDIGKRRNAAADIREYKDKMIWIRCAVEQFSFMDFAAAAEMAAIGYESAKNESEKLSALYKNGVSPSIVELRKAIDVSMRKAISNQYYFGRIEQPTSTQTLSLGIYSFQGTDYPYYLRDFFDIGLEYSWKYRKVELSLLAGGAMDATYNMHQTASLLLSSTLNYYPLSNMRLSLYGAATFNNKVRFYVPNLYLRQGFDYKLLSGPFYSLELNEGLEFYKKFFSNDAMNQILLSTRFKGVVETGFCDINASVGYHISFLGSKEPVRQSVQLNAATRLYFIPGMNFFFDVESTVRFSVDGKAGVPIYPSDGFITNARSSSNSRTSTHKPGGFEYGSFNSVDQNYIVILPLSIGYAFTKSPTFGELLMAEHLEVGVYCDLLFHDGNTPAFSTGVEVQTAISLIGLQKFPMTIRLGYDSLMNDFIWSLRFAIKQ